jgi:hypothetical protein
MEGIKWDAMNEDQLLVCCGVQKVLGIFFDKYIFALLSRFHR